MEPYNTHEREHEGVLLRVSCYFDPDMGPPWKEHDGHGDVSDWKSRDEKRPGERLLSGNGGSYRFYDWKGAIEQAKREGWGLDDAAKAALASKKGKPVSALTRGEIIEAAVQADFDYLAGWANNEWHWLGFTTEYSRDGDTWHDGNASCWGFDDEKCMLETAFSNVEAEVEALLENEAATALSEPACLI